MGNVVGIERGGRRRWWVVRGMDGEGGGYCEGWMGKVMGIESGGWGR